MIRGHPARRFAQRTEQGRRGFPRARMRGPARLLGLISAAGAMLTLMAVAAAAHAELRSITPEHKSVQASPPALVTLTFNQPVNDRLTVIKVSGPGGTSVESGPPSVEKAVVRQTLHPLAQPGRYQVAYRTLSVDGHVISGAREFTFQPAPGASNVPSPPAATAPASTEAARPGQRPSSGISWAQIGLVAVGVALVIGAALALRRTRRDG